MVLLHEFLFLHREELKQGIIKKEWVEDILNNLEMYEITDIADTKSDLLDMYEKILEFIYTEDAQTTKLIDEIVDYCLSVHYLVDDEYLRNSIEMSTQELSNHMKTSKEKIGLQELYECARLCTDASKGEIEEEIPKELTDFNLLSDEISTLNFLLKFSDNDEIKKYIIKNIELYKKEVE